VEDSNFRSIAGGWRRLPPYPRLLVGYDKDTGTIDILQLAPSIVGHGFGITYHGVFVLDELHNIVDVLRKYG
jgi:hypothetical protein